MIFLTGDIHASPERFSTYAFPEQKDMTKDDFVIICGDFGLVWDWEGESSREKYWLHWLADKPFTTLFIDGNHENFDRLNSYPEKEWHGGRVHEIRPGILHLMRGEMFDICEKKIFAFGGARSHDIRDGILDPVKDKRKIARWNKDRDVFRLFRVNKRTWWEQEMPNKSEMLHGIETLEKNHWKCDFILSHDGPASSVALLGAGTYQIDGLNQYLQEIMEKTEYKKWFFGHYHTNQNIDDKTIVIYEQIVQIA